MWLRNIGMLFLTFSLFSCASTNVNNANYGLLEIDDVYVIAAAFTNDPINKALHAHVSFSFKYKYEKNMDKDEQNRLIETAKNDLQLKSREFIELEFSKHSYTDILAKINDPKNHDFFNGFKAYIAPQKNDKIEITALKIIPISDGF